MKNSKYRITEQDFVKANRHASREEEIRAHGKQVYFRTKIEQSKKKYDRAKNKKAIREDGFSFSINTQNTACIRHLCAGLK